MKNLTYLFLTLGITILISCGKENKPTVEGYFYKDCSQSPIEPVTLKIYGNTTASFVSNPEKLVGEITTDVNGHFRLEYEFIKDFTGYKFYKSNRIFFSLVMKLRKNSLLMIEQLLTTM
jgi:hypothetical protein